MSPFTLRSGCQMISLTTPAVMGIVNLTPDSFYAPSRCQNEEALRTHIQQMVNEGAKMIDVGAVSTRPGAEEVSEAEEMKRFRTYLPVIMQACQGLAISIDTFRSNVAKMCVEEYGASIINDISAGQMDGEMMRTVGKLRVPYVIMHMVGNPFCPLMPPYRDMVGEIIAYFSKSIQEALEAGVHDIIVDPGFGFPKTLEQNYELLQHLEDLQELESPLLVGLSRKSMIYKYLDNSPSEALNGTSVLNTLALQKGANILRVHDVKAAVEVVKLVEKMKGFA